MYLGVFNLEQRLEQMKKLLKEKKRLKEMLDDDIKEIEKDIKNLENMIKKHRKSVSV
jgi:ferritin-like metal-binding protein YciE